MAHEIEGNKMVYKGTAPWHKIGVNVAQETTAAGMLSVAGMDTTVALAPCYALVNGVPVAIPEKQSVVRSDGKPLGVVGDRYQPVQNSEIADFCEALIGQGVNMETMGSLKGGRVVWALGQIPNGHGEDPVSKYVLVAAAHDGTMPVIAQMTPVRVVCNNTLSAAINGKHPNKLTIRHTRNASDRIAEAKRTIDTALSYFDRFEAIKRTLQDTTFTDADLKKVISKTFKFAENKMDSIAPVTLQDIIATTEQANLVSHMADNDKSRKAARDARILADIINLSYSGLGTNLPGVRGTAWGAWNAVTEYLDHHATTRSHDDRTPEERKLDSTWFGSIADKTQESLNVIMSMVSH